VDTPEITLSEVLEIDVVDNDVELASQLALVELWELEDDDFVAA